MYTMTCVYPLSLFSKRMVWVKESRHRPLLFELAGLVTEAHQPECIEGVDV